MKIEVTIFCDEYEVFAKDALDGNVGKKMMFNFENLKKGETIVSANVADDGTTAVVTMIVGEELIEGE